MRPFNALALCLSLINLCTAAITNPRAEVRQGDVNHGAGVSVLSWFHKLFRKDAALGERAPADDICVIDVYYDFVYNSTLGESLCEALINYPDQTVVVDHTPVSTFITTVTTRVLTHTEIVRETPFTTVTITASPAGKRDAEATPVRRGLTDHEVVHLFNSFHRQNAANNPSSMPDNAAMSASFSSACACQTYVGSTVTSTYTASPTTVTLSAFDRVQTTVYETRTEALATEFTTVTPAAPSSSAGDTPTNRPAESSLAVTGTSSAPPSKPTAPPFACPDDNNSTVSQMVGTMRYDYLIMCGTDISDPDFYSALTYSSFSECAAACSVADTRLQSAVCQGFAYYSSDNEQGYNCFLKASTNHTVSALGVDSGVLQRIAVGISNSNADGTSTEAPPFDQSPTADPNDLSSSALAVLTDSSTSMPVITPGPNFVPNGRVVPGQTYFSTYISDGSTFSTGTVFSTYYTSNGSWYYSYFTSYSLAWSSETTVYESSETSTAVANSTNSQSNSGTGENGDSWTIITTNSTTYFPGGYNVTQIISNITYDSSGTEIYSTATTSYYHFETGSAGGGSGGGNGGNDDNGAGIITSTSFFSTASVVTGGGGTEFVSSFYTSGVIPTPAPSISATTIVSTYGTAFSSGFAASGGGGNSGGANSTQGSGVVLSSLKPSSTEASAVPFTDSRLPRSGVSVSSTAPSSGVSGVSSVEAPGCSTVSSSGNTPSSGVLLTPIFSTVFSTGILGESSTQESSAISSSDSPFSPSQQTRSGTGVSMTTTVRGDKTFTKSVPYPSGPFSYPEFPAPSGPLETSSSASSSSDIPFTNSQRPRSGTLCTSSHTLGSSTAPVHTPPSGPISYPWYPAPSESLESSASPSSDIPFTNSQQPRSGTLRTSSHTLGSSTTLIHTLPSGPMSYPGFPTPNGSPAPSGSVPSSIPKTGSIPPGSSGFPSGAIPTGTTPTSNSSSGSPFSNSQRPRSSTFSSSRLASPASAPTGTASTLTEISPTPKIPPSSVISSCPTNYLGTTTIFTTVTEYGCYSNCVAEQQYGYGQPTYGPPSYGPQGFGSPHGSG